MLESLSKTEKHMGVGEECLELTKWETDWHFRKSPKQTSAISYKEVYLVDCIENTISFNPE